MSRKHFKVIASTIKDLRDSGTADTETVDVLAMSLADEFAKFNEHFDRDRFLTAAGVA